MKKILSLLFIGGGLYSLSAAIAITKQDANVRSEPSTKSEIVGVLRTNEDIEVIKKVFIHNLAWYKTPRGYVSAKLLEIQKSGYINRLKSAKIIKVYAQPSKDANVTGTLNTGYLDLRFANDEKIVDGNTYPWYKTDKGWVEGSWVEGVYIPKEQENTPITQEQTSKSTSDTKEVQKPIVKTEEPKKQKEFVKQQPKEQSEKDIQTRYFLGLSLHYNTFSVTQENKTGSIILPEQPDDSASSIGIHGGMRIEHFVPSINYEVVNLDDVKIQNVYVSLDYQFETILNPFIGLSIGMSDLEWQRDPLVNSQTKDSKLSSFMYGIEAGIEYTLIKHWSIYSDLTYQKFDFTTDLVSSPATAQLKHQDKKSIGVGVRYWF